MQWPMRLNMTGVSTMDTGARMHPSSAIAYAAGLYAAGLSHLLHLSSHKKSDQGAM